VADWGPTVADELRRDVRFALGWKVGQKLRPLTDTERDMAAAAILEHIRLCNWKIERANSACFSRQHQRQDRLSGDCALKPIAFMRLRDDPVLQLRLP